MLTSKIIKSYHIGGSIFLSKVVFAELAIVLTYLLENQKLATRLLLSYYSEIPMRINFMSIIRKNYNVFTKLFCKHHKSKHTGVILNQPIESEENDWIGVSTYVDNLAAAIKGGAKMVAITSDFGSGKSSLISLFKKRYEAKLIDVHIRPKYVYTINMWETIDSISAQDKMSVVDLHKSFLFHVINQLSPTKGSYLSKRLSKNYGLFSVESSSILKNILLVILILAFVLGEGLRRFGNELGGIFFLEQQHLQIFMFVAYVVGIICAICILFRSDFIFSSAKSEGNRELDENVLIDYYNHEVLYRKFWRHYIFVIEDLDRIDDINLVKGFLKEIRKYYLTDRNRRSQFHNNKVTFVINIKPEALLKNTAKTRNVSREQEEPVNKEVISSEKLYSKFFDYILYLQKINIDNYDSILLGLLKEIQDELRRLKLLKAGEEVLIENIPGMQWIIRGNELGIREIKNRLNYVLSLYNNLVTKFANSSITFEKCAIATYLVMEYEDDFYKIKDRDIESIVEKHISGKLEEDISAWGDNWKDLTNDFKRDLYDLVDNKMIDSNYRTYFYNYPQGSKLYDLSGNIVFNSIIYNERPKNTEEYEMHLNNTKEDVIEDAYRKVVQLNMGFPRFIVEFEKLFSIAANHYRQNLLDIISDLPFDPINISRTEKWVEMIVRYKDKIVQRNDLLESIAALLNVSVEDKEMLNVLRKQISSVVPEDILCFRCLFLEDNSFITEKEILSIHKTEVILQLVNEFKMSNSLTECMSIHRLIMEQPKNREEYITFYLNMASALEIEEVFGMLKEFCIGIDRLPENLREVLVEEVLDGNLESGDYIGLLCSITEIDAETVDSIITINWIQGLPLNICDKIAERGEYLNYVCNMVAENEKKLDLTLDKISDTIVDNVTWIYDNAREGWNKIRRLVLKDDRLIPFYLPLFGAKLPRIASDELDLVEDYKNAILILKENEITEDQVVFVAHYFNKKHRNQTESYEILQYLSELSKEVAQLLFFSLDMKRIKYNIMSSKRISDINSKLIDLFELEDDDELKIAFMEHVGMSISSLEKDLYIALNEDKILREKYLNYINSLEKVEVATIRNVVRLNSIYTYSDKINEKLFEMKYYKEYVSSKTAGMGKFEIEENRKEILWQTYKNMFNSSKHIRTRGYMVKNNTFMRMLIKDQAYKESGDQLMAYSAARQSKELIEYVISSLRDDEQCDYFSEINGFDSYEAAKFYMEIVIKNEALLESKAVYANTHDKLIDPGLKAKYTKARKKLLIHDEQEVLT